MKSSTTKAFRQLLEQLPVEVQQQAAQAYRFWQLDPHHSSLHFKRVSQTQPVYSVRIGINYRALGFQENNHIYWFWIGSHAEYDKLLKRLS